jgi:hypothetical protein
MAIPMAGVGGSGYGAQPVAAAAEGLARSAGHRRHRVARPARSRHEGRGLKHRIAMGGGGGERRSRAGRPHHAHTRPRTTSGKHAPPLPRFRTEPQQAHHPSLRSVGVRITGQSVTPSRGPRSTSSPSHAALDYRQNIETLGQRRRLVAHRLQAAGSSAAPAAASRTERWGRVRATTRIRLLCGGMRTS